MNMDLRDKSPPDREIRKPCVHNMCCLVATYMYIYIFGFYSLVPCILSTDSNVHVLVRVCVCVCAVHVRVYVGMRV